MPKSNEWLLIKEKTLRHTNWHTNVQIIYVYELVTTSVLTVMFNTTMVEFLYNISYLNNW